MAKKEKVVEETKNEPKGDVTKVQAKMKSDPVDLEKTNITKVNLDKPIKPEDNETKKDNADDSGVVAEPKNAEPTQEQKEIQPEAEAQEEKVLEEVVNTEDKIEEKAEEVKEQVEEAIAKTEVTGEPLPESVQKLVEFMNDTGGDLNDYVKLNQDYSKLDNQDLLFE